MLTAIISGILALVGGFLGAFMHRKTQHQNWLLEKRAEIFTDLLKTIEKCRDDASKYLRESPSKGMETEQKFLDIYQPAISYAKIARLFLKDCSKDEVDGLVSKIYALHSSRGLGDGRYKGMINQLNKLQHILEDNLKDPKW